MNISKYIKSDTSELLQLVSFRIGKEEFGVNILDVQEIIRMIEITEIPDSPEFVNGVVNLRSEVIPVVDLRVRLGLPKSECDNETRIIVMDLSGKTIGFVVDEVSEVLRIPNNITEPPPEMVLDVNSDFITGIGKMENKLIILLDLEKILSKEELELV